jgi:hypothetical protein
MASFRLAPVAFLLVALPSLSAAQGYRADYSPGSLKTLCPGWTYTIPVRVRNTGTFSWTQVAFKLSYHWYDTAGNVIVVDGLSTGMTVPLVTPGNEHTFQARLQVPSASLGTYVLKWDMLIENIGYFSQLGAPTKDVTVSVHALPCLNLARTAAEASLKFPAITSVWQGNVGPGDVVVVGGLNFGDTPGKLVLKGNAPGYPLGEVALDTPVWKDSVVGGIVPDSISGVVDQPATLRLSRADNSSTAEWALNFYATRELRYVDAADMATDCWEGSWKDWCNGIGAPASEFIGDFGKFSVWFCPAVVNHSGIVAGPIRATHQGHPWDWGVDHYTISLRNGWLFEDLDHYVKYSDTIDFLGNVSPFPTKIEVDAQWRGHPNGIGRATEYCVYVRAVGPRGVPYR